MKLSCFVLIALAACSPKPAETQASGTSSGTSSAQSTSLPTASSTGSASTTPLPSIDDSCKVAADCTIYMPSRPAEPCCPGCTEYKGANKASLDQFRAACAGRYAMCAGSCAARPTHAECKTGHCTAVVDP